MLTEQMSDKSRPPFDPSTMHLVGHPLPVLVSLASTDNSTVDLFRDSFLRPILLSTFALSGHTAESVHSCEAAHQLESFKLHMSALKEVQSDLAVFGLSTDDISTLTHIRNTLQLPFELLSDAQGELADKLDLPRFTDADGRVALRRCILVLEEGRVSRLLYPLADARDAGARAFRLLRHGMEPF